MSISQWLNKRNWEDVDFKEELEKELLRKVKEDGKERDTRETIPPNSRPVR